MTQAQLSKAVGVSQQSIGSIEKGDRKSTTKIVQISEALGCSPTWLASGTGDPDWQTEQEREMLRAYRDLPEDQQAVVDQLVRSLKGAE